MSDKKAPNPIDKHVGARVRMRRMMLSMSQEKMGDAVGLTFQQIQKYEKGTNRIGASRLQQFANVLQVPVAFFFEGAPNPTNAPDFAGVELPTLNNQELKLVLGFQKITDPDMRSALVAMTEALAQRAA